MSKTSPILDLENVNLIEFKKILEEHGYFYVQYKTTAVDGNIFNFQANANPPAAAMPSAALPRGFIPKESGSTRQEEKKIFSYGMDLETTNLLTGRNVWPSGFDHSSYDVFFNQVSALAKIITALISQIYTNSNETWKKLCDKGQDISIMRVFEYAATNEALGSSEHTDWGFLTIIKAIETVPGLQVFDKEWIDVPAIPKGEKGNDWFIVNAGDYLSLITNSAIKSPLHRVICTSHKRTAFVYFAYPNYDITLDQWEDENLSLFQDQSADSAGRIIVNKELKFGEFIYQKWKSVSRY